MAGSRCSALPVIFVTAVSCTWMVSADATRSGDGVQTRAAKSAHAVTRSPLGRNATSQTQAGCSSVCTGMAWLLYDDQYLVTEDATVLHVSVQAVVYDYKHQQHGTCRQVPSARHRRAVLSSLADAISPPAVAAALHNDFESKYQVWVSMQTSTLSA